MITAGMPGRQTRPEEIDPEKAEARPADGPCVVVEALTGAARRHSRLRRQRDPLGDVLFARGAAAAVPNVHL
jgi:hypothetical protein